MHIYTIGEREIWFLYFFNPYYFRKGVKTTFKVKRCHFLAIRVCLKSYFAAVLNELQVPFPG